MRIFAKYLLLCPVVLLPLAAQTCVQTVSLSGAYTVGGIATQNPDGSFDMPTTSSGYSVVTLTPTETFTFSQLTSLSVNFTALAGGSTAGSPRILVNFTNGKTLLILLGDSPSFVDTDTQLDAYSGFNVIGNNDSGRYDTATGGLGGSPFTTYSAAGVGALALAGSLTVANIQYVEDPTYGQHETLFSIGGAAQLACPEDAFQLRYVSNLGVGDSVIDISNDGASSSGTVFAPGGNLCVGVYSFDENEELLSCCSCFVTPNGLANLSAQAINSTSITGGTTTSSVIKLLAFQGTTAASCTGATISSTSTPLASGLQAWGTTVHALPVTGYTVTETKFVSAGLSEAEFNHITQFCQFNQINGSGRFGQCRGCTAGGE